VRGFGVLVRVNEPFYDSIFLFFIFRLRLSSVRVFPFASI
jgi:hypothetical protein